MPYQSGSREMRIIRRALRGALAFACAAGAALALTGTEVFLRSVLVLLFLLLTPAVALIGVLRDRDPLRVITAGIAASVAVNTLLAIAMLSFDAWSPRAGVATIAVVGAFLWVLRTLYRGDGGLRAEQGARSE
ncbi:hypothetical protein Ppa05_34000 [Planomonospora parontospora subsp. antibiotica]|nr:hypothetical protein Ppa05_34000 [Planomonospora parontospora subsp. antibiotica]